MPLSKRCTKPGHAWRKGQHSKRCPHGQMEPKPSCTPANPQKIPCPLQQPQVQQVHPLEHVATGMHTTAHPSSYTRVGCMHQYETVLIQSAMSRQVGCSGCCPLQLHSRLTSTPCCGARSQQQLQQHNAHSTSNTLPHTPPDTPDTRMSAPCAATVTQYYTTATCVCKDTPGNVHCSGKHSAPLPPPVTPPGAS
jgi:hypothetical protein